MINKTLSFKLPVTITKQGRRFVAYSPTLDVSTSGKSVKDVQSKFGEIVGIFLEEIIEAGTADDVLSELGWQKVQKRWNPPQVVSSQSVNIRMPVFA